MKPTVSIETWEKRIRAARQRRAQYEQVWAEYARLHTNAYLVMKDANDDPNVTLPSGDQVKVSLVFRNIEQTMGLLEVPEIGLRATLTDATREITGEDTHKEGVVEAALVRSMGQSGLVRRDEEVDFIKRDGVIIGHGINYSWWRQVEREVPGEPVMLLSEGDNGEFAPEIDEATGMPAFERPMVKETVWENVQDEQVSPLEFLFDADCQKSMIKSPWHGMEKIVKADALKEDPRHQIPPDIKPTAFRVKNLYGTEGEKADSVELDSFRKIVIWDKLNYELLTFLEGQDESAGGQPPKRKKRGDDMKLSLRLVRFERWPVTFDHPDDSPFSFFVPIPANDHPFGISQIEHIKNPAVEADKIRTRSANLTRQLKRIPWYQKGRVDPDQLKQAYNSPDAHPVGLDIRDGEKAEQLFGELPMPTVHAELFRQEVAAEDTVRKTTGTSEVPFGGAETATESENMMAIGGARPGRKKRLYLSFLTEVARKHLAFQREFAPGGQAVAVIGEDGMPTMLVYGREAFQGRFELEAVAGGGATAISPVQQKTMLELGAMLFGKFGPVFDRVFGREILTKLDFRNINKMLQAIPSYVPGPGGGTDGRLRQDSMRPADYTTGQAIRSAINPNELTRR